MTRPIPLARAVLSALLCAAPAAVAADPLVLQIEPKGAGRGEEIVLHLLGRRLHDAADVLADDPGLTFSAPTVVGDGEVTVAVRVAPDAPLGERFLRLRTQSGLSYAHGFWVGPFPTVLEREPNGGFADDQPVALGSTIAGRIERGDVDGFVVEAQAGERISAEIEALRLGMAFFDPCLALLDGDGNVVAAADDTELFVQDAWLSALAPAAGRYHVVVRDTTRFGGPRFDYRLHVGRFPRPRVVYPAGGRTGTTLDVRFLGGPGGDVARRVELPEGGRFPFGLFLGDDDRREPSWTPFRLTGFGGVREQESNDTLETATAGAAANTALDGILQQAGDVDWFRCDARAGEAVRLRVWARDVGSPADTVLSLHDATGTLLAENDDAGRPDSVLDWTAPADGPLWLRVRERFGRGGPTHVYRVEATVVRPYLVLSTPRHGRDSQARQVVTVPQGGRTAVVVRAARGGFAGEVAFDPPRLPAGVTARAPSLAADLQDVPLLFEAAAEAPLAGASVRLFGRSQGEPRVVGRWRQSVELLVVPPTNVVYERRTLLDLPLAVVEPAPAAVEVVPPAVSLVAGGLLDLTVQVTRAAGFAGPVTLRPLGLPRGVGAPATTVLPADASATRLRLDATADARRGSFPLVIQAEADDADGGVRLSASQVVPVEVVEPAVRVRVPFTAVPRGAAADVTCLLEIAAPFPGTARLRLLDLPHGLTAPEREFTAGASAVSVPVTAAGDARLGRVRRVLCEVLVPAAGGVLVHRVALADVLRVDAPGSSTPAAPAAAAPALDRLDQLRAAAARRAAAREDAP